MTSLHFKLPSALSSPVVDIKKKKKEKSDETWIPILPFNSDLGEMAVSL